MKTTKKPNQDGFTLIELIVVIVIIGILSSVAVPKFLSITEEAKQVASDGTYAAMKSACTVAFAKHRAAQLEKSTSGDNKYITNAKTLEYYLEGGFPEGVRGRAITVTLLDNTIVTIVGETNDVPASLSRI